MRRLSLRARLTLAFALASAVLLALVGTYIYLQVKSGLDASLDASLRSRAGEYARLARTGGDGALRRALAVEGEPAQLLGADGGVLAASPRGRVAPLVTGRRLARARVHGVGFERGERTRYFARPAGPGTAVVVSVPMRQRERALETLGGVLLVGGPLILLLSSGAGFLVAAGALRPVERMRRRAADISEATPDARLPLPVTHDEIHRLGETLNAMLARLQESAVRERAFLETASHELRTPLAILKAEVDLALEAEPGNPALASVAEEVARLARLAEDLLVLARAEDGQLRVRPEPLDLHDVVAGVTGRFALLGDVRNDVPAGLAMNGDRLRLEQALGNLIANGLRHGAPPVRVFAAVDEDAVVLHVSDHGDGFRPAEGDTGLGLTIVDTIARAHGGSSGAGSTPGGADAWIRLPTPRPSGVPAGRR